MSVRAVGALEEILRLPDQALVRLLDRPRSDQAQPGPDLRCLNGFTDPMRPLNDCLDRLPGSQAHDIDFIARQDRANLDAEGRVAVVRSRIVIRPRHDGVDRYFLRLFGNEGSSIDKVRVELLEHCRLGRVVRHFSESVMVAELRFDHVLRAGETWVFEYEVSDPTGKSSTDYAHEVRGFEEHCLVEVRFHPDRLPVGCYSFIQRGPDDEPERTADLALNKAHAVHHVETAVAAGWVGIGWSWG